MLETLSNGFTGWFDGLGPVDKTAVVICFVAVGICFGVVVDYLRGRDWE